MSAPIALGSLVDVIGGKYTGKAGKVVGSTNEFWKLEIDCNEVRCKKNHVKGAEESTQEAANLPDSNSEAKIASEPDFPSEAQSEVSEAAHFLPGVLVGHALSILTWNANKLSFMKNGEQDPNAAASEHYLLCFAQEVTRCNIEVLVLQEVPKVVGEQRVRELLALLNETLRKAGTAQERLFSADSLVLSTGDSREKHAVLARKPIKVEWQETITSLGGVVFSYPPLVVLLHDDRFTSPALKRVVLTSVHTPGSGSDVGGKVTQRAKELNALLHHLNPEVKQLLGDRVRFHDRRAGKKCGTADACASPIIMCGDLNTDLYKSEKGLKPDVALQLLQDLRFSPRQEYNRVKVYTAAGEWVAGSPAAAATCGGRCLDWYLWNADIGKRVNIVVKALRLAAEATKGPGRLAGLSDHDALMLELTEDPWVARPRPTLKCSAGPSIAGVAGASLNESQITTEN